MVKIPQITTSNDEVSLSQHPHHQCKTLWPWIKWMPVYFHSNIHIRVISMFCKSSVSRSCAHTLHNLGKLVLYGWAIIKDFGSSEGENKTQSL